MSDILYKISIYMEYSMQQTLTSIVQSTVLNAQRSREIAETIGKPYPTMMRELNPFDSSAKLGIETLIQIIKITGDVTPLEFMAETLGYRIEKIDMI